MASIQERAKERGVTLNNVWYEADDPAVVAFVPQAPNGDLAGFTADVTSVAASAHGFAVRIKNVKRSTGASKAIQSRLAADTGYWAELGITITAHGINTDGDTVIADVLDAKDLDDVRRQMIARYGQGIDVQNVSGRAQPASRPSH
ncbi:hypothetical protein V3C33_20185 [Micrococcaceae bacterium Sec5.7]